MAIFKAFTIRETVTTANSKNINCQITELMEISCIVVINKDIHNSMDFMVSDFIKSFLKKSVLNFAERISLLCLATNRHSAAAIPKPMFIIAVVSEITMDQLMVTTKMRQSDLLTLVNQHHSNSTAEEEALHSMAHFTSILLPFSHSSSQ